MRFSFTDGAAGRATRAAAAVLATAGLAGAVLAAPATARPPIGPVKNLAANVSKPSSSYQLAVDWSDLAGASSYKVKLSLPSGTVLATDTVSASQWTVSAARPAGTSVRVTVVPFSSTRKGKPATVTKALPDLTAPLGVFDLDSHTNTTVTVTQTSLSDDVSLPASIQREINWGAGGGWVAWPSGTTISNSGLPYAATAARYVPQVRLTDAANNVGVVDVGAVVIQDGEAPTGSFNTVHPTTMWAKFTAVSLTQAALDDTCNGTCVGSPAAAITRVVTWGDGTTTTWAAGAAVAKHVYQTAGSFTPSIALTDEVAKTTEIGLSTLTVKADKVAPVVSLTKPKVGLAMVRSWRILHGKVVDAGVGMGKVRVKVVEKRGSVWYAYLPAKKTWVKGGTTRLKAMKLAGLARLTPAGRFWQLRVAKLAKGTLVVQYSAADRALNTSKVRVVAQKLTKS